ncbi:MAG: carboxypeptidase regulatory-like domain-containing protein, partial [Bryobacterales bacterium]|nr:carboxypeptidase regulatory-like domain-containing protein [Bryobacterales bacterium]
MSSVAISLVFLAGVSLLAQGTGSIRGTILDPTGAAVPGAKITLRELRTNSARQAASDTQGTYQFTPVGPGEYRLEVEASGFQRYSQSGLLLQVDERLRADVTLQIGSMTETVQVNDQGATVNTQDAVLRNVVDAKRMVDLPLNGRNA